MSVLTPEQISDLPLREQYLFFVNTVVEHDEIWGLFDEDREGWILTHDGERERLPLWPTVHFAEACRSGDWLNCTPMPMEASQFVRETTDELIDMGRGLSVLYLDGEGGLDIEPEQLRKDLLLLMSRQEEA
jgi:hypothetical protein